MVSETEPFELSSKLIVGFLTIVFFLILAPFLSFTGENI